MIRASQQFFDLSTWIEIKDGDDAARWLFDRHYSRYRYADGRTPKLFVGPGQKLVLTSPCRRALFVWRKFMSADDQVGVGCAVFRNEGPERSSDLIIAADEIAFARWPGERHFTYVNPRAITSANPGYCFKRAGWVLIRDEEGRPRLTKARKYLILERLAP